MSDDNFDDWGSSDEFYYDGKPLPWWGFLLYVLIIAAVITGALLIGGNL